MKEIPKIELHLHLDGSIRIETLRELSHEEDIEKEIIANEKCKCLDDYLTKFNLPIEIMQTKDVLERVAFELTEDLEKENVIYAEVRYAPMFHTRKGLSMEEGIMAVLKGLQRGKIKTNLILCMMRGVEESINREVIDLAYQFKDKGVCGIDLAGSEAKYPVMLYKDLFSYAREKDIPFTIHAGEASGSESVKDAVTLGASRIGHGIHAIEDSSLLKLLKGKQILLEVCPTSNVQTDAVKTYESHPIRKLFEERINVLINTDNRTVSNITLTEEYEKLMHAFGFTKEEFLKMNEIAIHACFLSKKEKEDLHLLFLAKIS